MPEESVSLSMRRVVAHPELPPQTFSKVLWTRVGKDFVLEIAHWDLPELRDSIERAKKEVGLIPEVTIHISQRYSLSPDRVLELLSVCGQVAREFVKQELLQDAAVTQAYEGKLEEPGESK